MESAFTDLFIIYITTIKRKRVKKYINLSLSKNTFRPLWSTNDGDANQSSEVKVL